MRGLVRYDVRMFVLLYATFGAIIGSFLNVLILRHGTGRNVRGRSACAACGRTLTSLDLIPIVSWVTLRGKCRQCGSAISAQYPIVEMATVILFGLIGGMALPLLATALACAIAAVLLAIAVYDIRHTIIPDAWVVAYTLLAICAAFVNGGNPLTMLTGAFVCAVPLFGMWFFSGGRAMGLGDVKLALGMGVLLGPWVGLFTIGLAFVVGSIFFLPLLAVSHMRHSLASGIRVTMKSEVPFGPFLVVSFFIVWFTAHYGYSVPAFLGLVW